MFNPKSIHTKTAFVAISEYLKTGNVLMNEKKEIPKELAGKNACFVTLRSGNGDLRGCIGTLSPVYENLYTEIVKNAISSAVRDSRFSKLTIRELNDISLSVEVLSEPELVQNNEQLDPRKYGLIISDGSYRRGVLLPDIEGVDTVTEQIRIVKQKAGIYEIKNDNLEFYRFTTDRFY